MVSTCVEQIEWGRQNYRAATKR